MQAMRMVIPRPSCTNGLLSTCESPQTAVDNSPVATQPAIATAAAVTPPRTENKKQMAQQILNNSAAMTKIAVARAATDRRARKISLL
jgi:hypothetical protein